MKTLFFTRNLTGFSTVWMRRMLRHLRPSEVRLILDEDEPRRGTVEDSLYREYPPTYLRGIPTDLKRGGLRKRVPRLVRRALGVSPPRKAGLFNTELLRSLFLSSEHSALFINYLQIATSWKEGWLGIDKPVFVHCHGFDVTWDLKKTEPDGFGLPAYPETYVEEVRNLPDNVHLIANSRHTFELLRQIGFPDKRITLKYFGIPCQPEFEERDNTTDEVTILYLGRLIDCKGPDLTIQAFEQACRKGLKGRLVIAGDGNLRVTCELLARRSEYRDRIELLGAVDEVTGNELRSRADIFTGHNCRGLLGNQEEAFGVSYVEAMGMGLPVVSGANGSLPEIVENGKTGILVPPGDVEAHANALLRLAADPELRRTMGRSAWEHARRSFSPQQERETLRSLLGLPL